MNNQGYEIISYPDGGKYVKVTEFKDVISYNINSYEDLFLLASIKDVYNFNKKSLSLHIPCMFQQQHDRRFNDDESFDLKIVCDFINNLKFESVTVFHAHSDVTPALLDNCKIIDNKSFVADTLLSIYSTAKEAENKCILMSTDAGGFKPLMKLVDKLNWKGKVYSASKSRKFIAGESKLIQVIDKSDFDGKDVLLIDDLCVYGGTFIGLAKLLKEKNVGNLYLATSHLTVPNPNTELFDLYTEIFTTNSKGLKYPDKIKIINK
jgi:ribose-phosphate pyrophosphokinase